MTARKELESALSVSRETMERLDAYADLLKKWNKAINLVGPATVPDLWTRHFLDSAQIFSCYHKAEGDWVDVGSGAGFPGLVVATIAAQLKPQLTVTCIESDQRKAAFLRTVIRELGLNASVLAERIENVPELDADVMSARALAPLSSLIQHADRHLKPAGKAIFPKGAGYLQEIQEARSEWSFDIQTIPSKTDDSGAVLILGGIRRE